MEDPYMPLTFGTNQKGMQPAAPLEGWKLSRAQELWLKGRDLMVELAKEMAAVDCVACNGKRERIVLDTGGAVISGKMDTCPDCKGTGEGLNVHKQLVNRLHEPWSWITCADTGR